MSSGNSTMNRCTGLLIIEAINSNPNGDPDRESDPRWRNDEHGEISPVSLKRKVRDLIGEKEGPIWESIASELDLDAEHFHILETRGRDREAINTEIEDGTFTEKYWDARIFGNTFLESGEGGSVKTGVVQFGLGLSVAPIEIERMTNTNKAGVEEGKDRGMAPMSYRIVQHGVYAMPFFINPTAAVKSGCTAKDIEVLKSVLPYAYLHTASYSRPSVEMRHAWFVEHTSPLGSCSDFALLEALTPKKKADPDQASKSWSDYEVPNILPDDLKGRIGSIEDLLP